MAARGIPLLLEVLKDLPAYRSEARQQGSDEATYAKKILKSEAELDWSREAAVLERAIGVIAKANRVEFYGFGASGSVVADAQHKFFRLQLSTAAYTDPHIQHMSAASLGKKDVVVAISQSGKSRALLQSVRLARDAGATVIGLVVV